MTDNIIDVSHWEAPIDFAKVAGSGIVAVIAKATQGAAEIDQAYAGFKTAVAAQGLLWGSYHFGTSDDASAQVDHYLATAKPTDKELVCLDFEPNPYGKPMSIGQAREFVAVFAKRTGRWPVLYGGNGLKIALTRKADEVLSKCPLWIAQYGKKVTLPPGWDAYTLWQFTESEHRIGGIKSTDRDRFDGSDDDLRKRWPFT